MDALPPQKSPDDSAMNALLLAYLGNAIFAQGSDDDGVVRWFEDLMHEDAGVRDAVRHQLLRVGSPAIPCLVQLLEHESHGVHMWAASLLIDIGEPAVDALRRADSDDRPEPLRRGARSVLRRMRCA